MGCSSAKPILIDEEELNPEIIAQVTNRRIKTKLYPEGEIYYLRNHSVIKKNSIPTADSKGLLAYDNTLVELTVEYKFNKPELIKEFRGTRIKLYHTDVTKDNQFTYIGSTEPLKENTLKFDQKFQMYFCFQKKQQVKFEVILSDNIQLVNTTLGSILGSKFLSVEIPFYYKGNTEDTSIIVKGKVLKDENKCSFIILNILTDFSKLPYSDYFIVIYNWNNGKTKQKVWKSNEHQGKQFHFIAKMITLDDLCLGENDRKITFEWYGIYSGKIGSVDTNLNELNNAMYTKTPIVIKGGNNEELGSFYIDYKIEKISRFVDLIENGLQLQLSIAIDYTGSNGDPKNPESLHYCGNKRNPNQYEQVIKHIGELCQCYDFYKKFPSLGFGGVVPPLGETSHCFNITLNRTEYIEGLENVIAVYEKTLDEIKLDGPTYFCPIMKENFTLIKENDEQSETSVYHVILLITDGTIHDMDDFKKTLIKNSEKPFSVIVVGVGKEDFSNMFQLGGDDNVLEDKNGTKCNRDICQFVRYKDFKNPLRLREKVLMILPNQIEQYYRIYNGTFVGVSDALNGKYAGRKLSKLGTIGRNELKKKLNDTIRNENNNMLIKEEADEENSDDNLDKDNEKKALLS